MKREARSGKARWSRALGISACIAIACRPGPVDTELVGDTDSDAPIEPSGYLPDPVTMGEDLPSVVPVLRITVGVEDVEKDVEIPGTIEVFEAHDGTLTDLDGLTPMLSSPIGFQGRGNFTWSLPKKGYAFELQDGAGGSVDRELLGMPPGSDFALYACTTDKTCLRNALVYGIGQELGRWSPRTRYVELVLDGEYQGLYMVWERVRRDPQRVDLPKPAATAAEGDISGGYIIRYEGYGKGSELVDGEWVSRDFTLASGNIYTWHFPDVDKLTPEQSAYVLGHFQRFEDGMPDGYAPWIDGASWVDRGIVEEVTNNWDGYVHSLYLTKDADADGGRLGMGPLWDFDLAFANGNVTGWNCATDTWAYQIERGHPDDVPDYWLGLYADPTFQTAWKCRYQELREGPLAMSTFESRIQAWVAFTAAARARDQALWPTIGVPTFPNCTTEPTYDAEVAFLRGWIDARLTWLDAQAEAMPGACP